MRNSLKLLPLKFDFTKRIWDYNLKARLVDILWLQWYSFQWGKNSVQGNIIFHGLSFPTENSALYPGEIKYPPN